MDTTVKIADSYINLLSSFSDEIKLRVIRKLSESLFEGKRKRHPYKIRLALGMMTKVQKRLLLKLIKHVFWERDLLNLLTNEALSFRYQHMYLLYEREISFK